VGPAQRERVRPRWVGPTLRGTGAVMARPHWEASARGRSLGVAGRWASAGRHAAQNLPDSGQQRARGWRTYSPWARRPVRTAALSRSYCPNATKQIDYFDNYLSASESRPQPWGPRDDTSRKRERRIGFFLRSRFRLV